METVSTIPGNYAAVGILRDAPVDQIIAMGFGTHLSEIDIVEKTSTTENYFTSDGDGNLTVATDLTEAPAQIRCISTYGVVIDVTLN